MANESLYKKLIIRNINKLKNIIILVNTILMMNLFIQAFPSNNLDKIKLNSSIIKLKIRGTGFKNIFCGNTSYFRQDYYPNEVYIDGTIQIQVNNIYEFNEIENNIELRWTNDVLVTRFLFYKCSSIAELDLSKFDTSKVNDMTGMFFDCYSLTSLDLSNMDTSKVQSMYAMFYNCASLTSLNLSSFNTINVVNMDSMFNNCKSLTSLNLSNFNTQNVTTFEGIFYYCNSLISMDLQNFDTSKAEIMTGMFFGCNSLTFLNISSFVTTNVESMAHMFRLCWSLTSINLSKFDTTKVTDMTSMFYNCSSLTELDLSNFRTSNTQDMRTMFRYCSKLTSLDIQNFDTSKVICMLYMFSDCSSLTSLNLSRFDTSLVTDMDYMFNNCSSLSSLDLSSFYTPLVIYMENMFGGCIYLEYINMKNFGENRLRTYNNMFYGVPENVVICINNNNNKIISQLPNPLCYNIYYSDTSASNQKKIIYNTNTCVDDCNNHATNNYEYNGKCYQTCQKGLVENNNNICICELEQCRLCPSVALSKGLCTKCNDNYYKIENDPNNLGEYFNCYKDPKGYYLDKDDSLYKKCYEKCETCELKGDDINNNCLKCNEDYPISISFNNYTNCYKNCTYYHYFDSNNIFHCTLNSSCPLDFPKLIENKSECIQEQEIISTENKESFSTAKDIEIISTENIVNFITNKNSEIISSKITEIFSTQIYINNNNITDMMKNIINSYIKNETEDEMLEEIKYYDMILKNIEKIFTSEEFNKTNLENGKDDIYETANLLITLTTSFNQKNNKITIKYQQ